jgi:CheY-like chemotaxis protein/HPt (histidine-containing phosphotransfer) domain-containing protein
VRGDRVRVSQILTNLIGNAVKFTNAGEVVVEVSTSARSEETIEVHFEVRDTGIGIAPERIPGLFEPFTQADPGTARRYGGTGLGLAISRELTQLMGGAIEADSRLGVGSCFRFTIPFAPAQTELRPPVAPGEAAPPAAREAAPPGRPAPAGVRVLVAEDQGINWMVVDRLLAKDGHVAANAIDGRQAVAMLESGGYELVLMDCQMPGLDGYETAREIRRREAATGRPRVPIVAMTANALVGAREACLAAGMDDYIAKPISLQALEAVLVRWLPAEAPAHLDRERLAELRLVFPGPELIEMLRGIDGELVAELGSLEAAIRDRERAAAGAAAHRIRNSAHVIGATALAAAAEPFELRLGESLSGDSGVSAADVERLREQWRAARAALAVELEDAAHQR